MRYGRVHRFLCVALLALCCTLPLDGCSLVAVTGMYLAHKSDARISAKSAREYAEVKLKYISELKMKGDPLGDYLYAIGNAEGWIEDAKTNDERLELFDVAIAKGSSEAKVKLGYYYFSGRSIVSGFPELGYEEVSDSQEKGMKLILDGLKGNCSLVDSYPETVSVVGRRICYQRYAAAYDLAFLFERGQLRRDKNREYREVIAKNSKEQAIWTTRGDQCSEWLKKNYVDKCLAY